MEKFSWTEHVKHKEALHRVKKERNNLHSIYRWKATFIGHSSLAFYSTDGRLSLFVTALLHSIVQMEG